MIPYVPKFINFMALQIKVEPQENMLHTCWKWYRVDLLLIFCDEPLLLWVGMCNSHVMTSLHNIPAYWLVMHFIVPEMDKKRNCWPELPLPPIKFKVSLGICWVVTIGKTTNTNVLWIRSQNGDLCLRLWYCSKRIQKTKAQWPKIPFSDYFLQRNKTSSMIY